MSDSISIAFVDNKSSPVTKIIPYEWEDLCALLTHHRSGQKDGQGWLPADIAVGPRSKERVTCWSVLVLDIEGATEKDENGHKQLVGLEAPTINELAAELELWGWAACIASSYSHLEENLGPRYRLIMPVSKPIPAESIKELAYHIAALLGLSDCWDSGCADPARLFYLPRCPAERMQLAESRIIEGAALDIDAMFKAVENKRIKPATNGQKSASVIDEFNRRFGIGELLEGYGYLPKRGKRWLWPNSSSGIPGVVKLPDSERIYSHHPGDPLSNKNSHDVFSAYCMLEHNGDQSLAVKAAAELLGMKKQQSNSPAQKPEKNPLDQIDAMRKAMMTTQEKIAHFEKIKHLIPELALQGHHTYLYGASGSYKTTFVTALALQAAKSDEEIHVHYWGFDVSPPYVMAVLQLIKENGLQARFSMFSGSTVSEMKTYYSIYLENNIRMDNVLVILDTYKFLSDDINNKNSNKDAMHYIKSICKLGAAWLSIGHSNKNNEHHSGTAEVEQDSDALLRIDCISSDSGKVVSAIKKGGRCRWGDPKMAFEAEVLSKSKQVGPSDYWYHSIKSARRREQMPDVEKVKAAQKFEKDFVPVLHIIIRHQKEHGGLINKSLLEKSIKDSELIDLSKRETNLILEAGDGKHWRIIQDRENNNRLLYEPIWYPPDNESIGKLIENSQNKNIPSDINGIT